MRNGSTCFACVAALRASAVAVCVAIRPSFACRNRFSRFTSGTHFAQYVEPVVTAAAHSGQRNCVLGTTSHQLASFGETAPSLGQSRWPSELRLKNPEVSFDSSPTCGEIRSIVMKSSNGLRKILRRFSTQSLSNFEGQRYAADTRDAKKSAKYFKINGAGGGNRTHGLGIMRPSLYH